MNYIERLQILFRKKFKIYNEKTGEITDPFTFYHLHNNDNECNPVLYDSDGINPDIRILLFTGKKDIDNEELYETDIVIDTNSNIYIIVYDENFASFMLFSNETNKKLFLHSSPVKKIGNLYTNPKLLKGE